MLVVHIAIFITTIISMNHSYMFRNNLKAFSCWLGRSQAKSFATSKLSQYNDVISSDANEKIKIVRSLKDKKNRDYYNLVLLEGYRHINDALAFGITPKHILISQSALARKEGNELYEKLLGNALIVKDSIMNSLCETVTSQGVLATFEKPSSLLDIPIRKDSSGPIVILDRLADPGNVGTIIRSCYGLGVSAMIFITGGCDIWSPKVVRSSMGLSLNRNMPLLELTWSQTNSCISKYRDRIFSKEGSNTEKELQILLADGEDNNLSYESVDFTIPTVLVIGSEATGVSNEARSLRGVLSNIRIPMVRQLESFNAAMAGSIILAEAARQRRVDAKK